MAKKNFKKDPTAAFLSDLADGIPTFELEDFIKTDEAQKKSKKANIPKSREVDLPNGYKIVRETKSSRLNLLIRPSTRINLDKIADAEGTSTNDLINRVLEQYIIDYVEKGNK